MYVRRNLRWRLVLRFSWLPVLFFAIWSAAITYAHVYVSPTTGISLALPFLPLSTIGIAVAFYIGFKNSQSYDRFWEARKIWGGIINASRSWANQVLDYVTNYFAETKVTSIELANIHRELIYRQIAWVNSLRLHLRRPSSFSKGYTGSLKMLKKGTTDRQHCDSEVLPFLCEEEHLALTDFTNIPLHILRYQGEQLRALREESGLIEDFRHTAMMETLNEMIQLQGRCERIKNTPFPRQYAFFSSVFTWIFILLLPFGLLGAFDEQGDLYIWLTIPFHVLISWIYYTMESVGDNSEDPFENFINDVPMTAICRLIEINLREMLGETEIPQPIQPENDILW